MNFGDFVDDIQSYLHFEGTDAETQIKSFTNESIYDFMRLYDWEKLKVADDLTLDGSDEYTLDVTNLTSTFEREIQLIAPYNASVTESSQRTQYGKYNYYDYLQLASKDYAYAIHGTKIYVAGDNGTLKLCYISPGDFTNFPLSDDTDEIPALIYYTDVIKKFVIVKFLDFMNEDSSRENNLLALKIESLKRGENRGRNSGMPQMIQRGGLGSSGV